jgi:hypothetical protein
LDENQLKPYLELNHVLEDGVFFAAHQLYGITFKERHDLPVYRPDVRVFEVYDVDGKPLAILLEDFYARPSKKGGAWMNEYVSPVLPPRLPAGRRQPPQHPEARPRPAHPPDVRRGGHPLPRVRARAPRDVLPGAYPLPSPAPTSRATSSSIPRR